MWGGGTLWQGDNPQNLQHKTNLKNQGLDFFKTKGISGLVLGRGPFNRTTLKVFNTRRIYVGKLLPLRFQMESNLCNLTEH